MLNKLLSFDRQYRLMEPGDTVVCAVSGGADSMALLWAMYLLREKLNIRLEAAHFNHHLRGEESDRDEAFVREFCERYEITLHVGSGSIQAGEKGLEAAAREARYAFFDALPGKIATAHTANDNAETVLMRMVRGTGLKGLGAIAPARGNVIRPMLTVTRQDILAFLEEYHISYVEDSSNGGDAFLRNRLRHRVMPILEQENPRLAENLSAMALRLREENALLEATIPPQENRIEKLKQMHSAQRARALRAFLEHCGVREPEAEHVMLAEKLVFSDNPSARAAFPDGVTVSRNYGVLEKQESVLTWEPVELTCPGTTVLPSGYEITCTPTQECVREKDCFTVQPQGRLMARPRQQADHIRLSGGTKSLKKLFVDHKIPASERSQIPVVVDELGVLGVYGVGADLDRLAHGGVQIRIRRIER